MFDNGQGSNTGREKTECDAFKRDIEVVSIYYDKRADQRSN